MCGMDDAYNEALRNETHIGCGKKVFFSSLMSVKLSCNAALGGPVLFYCTHILEQFNNLDGFCLKTAGTLDL